MSYQNAPATRMLASHCAVCGNPLVDARSVETGIGPVCRRRHGYGSAQADPDLVEAKRALAEAERLGAPGIEVGEDPDPRQLANRAVYHIAAQPEARYVASLVEAISVLGFRKLAGVIACRRLGAITVEQSGDVLTVKAPFNQCFNERVRSLPGQHFDRKARVRKIPIRHRRALWSVLRECFAAGTLVVGNRVARI